MSAAPSPHASVASRLGAWVLDTPRWKYLTALFTRLFLCTGVTLVALPFFVGTYPRYILTLWMIYAIATIGLNIPMGLAGIYSFGHGGFTGTSGYVVSGQNGRASGRHWCRCSRIRSAPGRPSRRMTIE